MCHISPLFAAIALLIQQNKLVISTATYKNKDRPMLLIIEKMLPSISSFMSNDAELIKEPTKKASTTTVMRAEHIKYVI